MYGLTFFPRTIHPESYIFQQFQACISFENHLHHRLPPPPPKPHYPTSFVLTRDTLPPNHASLNRPFPPGDGQSIALSNEQLPRNDSIPALTYTYTPLTVHTAGLITATPQLQSTACALAACEKRKPHACTHRVVRGADAQPAAAGFLGDAIGRFVLDAITIDGKLRIRTYTGRRPMRKRLGILCLERGAECFVMRAAALSSA